MNSLNARIISSTALLHGWRSMKKACPWPGNSTSSTGFPIAPNFRTYSSFPEVVPGDDDQRRQGPASVRPARTGSGTGGPRWRWRGGTAGCSGRRAPASLVKQSFSTKNIDFQTFFTKVLTWQHMLTSNQRLFCYRCQTTIPLFLPKDMPKKDGV
jgi:hypothetical protein